jgi:hypothetical protein
MGGIFIEIHNRVVKKKGQPGNKKHNNKDQERNNQDFIFSYYR